MSTQVAINGRRVDVPDDASILVALRQAGVDVPALCTALLQRCR
jgi:NADH dehydrogenase/NADH:ubiquinone oxidoreductase subunit G